MITVTEVISDLERKVWQFGIAQDGVDRVVIRLNYYTNIPASSFIRGCGAEKARLIVMTFRFRIMSLRKRAASLSLR